MYRWLSPIAGTALVTLALVDIFQTVLYARIGTALFTEAMGAGLWALFKRVAPRFPRHRDKILSFCGPVLLVFAVAVWVTALAIGFALIVWPRLGTSIVSGEPSSPTPTDFGTALYYSGSSLTTAFGGNLVPRTWFFHVLVAVESAVGISVLTLTLTYFLEVYNALLRRNTLAQSLHHATGGTGDAAEWVAGLGAGGDFKEARGELAGVASAVLNFHESQHLYPILIYFRFREARYAISRKALIGFDTVTLVRTALDADRYASFAQSSPVTQLWNGSLQLMAMMSKVFLGKEHPPDDRMDIDAGTERRWRRRFHAACERLRAAGIATAPDEREAAGRYVALRRQWQCYVDAFADYMQRSRQEIDPCDRGEAGEAQPAPAERGHAHDTEHARA
jgi:hypothetical protein